VPTVEQIERRKHPNLLLVAKRFITAVSNGRWNTGKLLIKLIVRLVVIGYY
jgi:hypothetical protein